MTALIILLAIWEVYWTYQACWLASKLDQRKWFLFFLVFNLLGIPEMIYLKKQGQKLLRRP
jgi:hypothetical protein